MQLMQVATDGTCKGRLPGCVTACINRLKKAKTKQECLERAFEFMISRYRGSRLLTYLQIYKLLDNDVCRLWRKKGFLHCTKLNRLLIFLLVSSGRFRPEQIRKKWALVYWFSPHQYLEIKTEKGWAEADVWAFSSGIPLGKHAAGFNIPLIPK